MSKESLWDSQETAQQILKERSRLQEDLDNWNKRERELEETLILYEITKETNDPKDLEELISLVGSLDKSINGYEIDAS